MEGLNLSELEFDSSDDIFNLEEVSSELLIDNKEKENKEIINSEEPKTPESVAIKEENKEQVQATDETPQGNEGSSNSSSPQSNDTEQLYSSLAAEFKAKGVLSSLDLEKEKISSMEDINKALEKELEARLSEKQKVLDNAINAGAPVNQVAEQVESIDKLKSIDSEYLSSEENQELRLNIIAQDFINRGFKQDKALSMAQRSIDLGEDIDDAINALNDIISLEESKLNAIIKETEDREKNALKDIKNFINDKEEIVPGIKLTIKQKEDLFNQVTTDVGNKDSAFIKAQKENPLETRMKLEAIFFLTKGLTDFSVFGNARETQVSRGIEDLLRGAKFTESGGINTNVKDANANFTIKDLENLSFGE